MTAEDDHFTKLIRKGTPDELRSFCDLAEADVAITPDVLTLIRMIRVLADNLQHDLELAGVDCGLKARI